MQYFSKHEIRSFVWNSKDTLFLKEIIKYAKLLSKLRGSLITWKSKEEAGEYEHTYPIIEELPRAINSLRNLARGHALINGRDYLREEDLEIVRRVCLSSMPYDRYKFLELLRKHNGKLTTEIIGKELSCSDDTARRAMKVFEVLGVVDVKSLPIGNGKPMYYVEIKPEFMDLINQTQVRNNAEKSNPQENSPVRVNPYDKFELSELDKELENG